jgi:hypothetical protein
VDRFVWGGYYEEGSMIWRSRWVTNHGIIECREALAFPGDPHRAVLLRRITAVDGHSKVRITLAPRAGFGRHHLTRLHHADGTWTGRSGPPAPTVDRSTRQQPPGGPAGRLIAGLVVPAGNQHDLILEISDQAPDRPPDPGLAWEATDNAWAAAAPDLDNCLEPRDSRRSWAVLRGLTSAGGGMVAAATTSLPERAEAGRNYDYRYVWIRDQCYAGQAATAGAPTLVDDAVRFVTARILDHGPDLKPAYTTGGAAVPDQRTLDLPGYPGGKNLIGNWVNQQFQLDAFGESLLCWPRPAGPTGWTPTTGRPRSSPPTPSAHGGPNPTPGSGRSTTNAGRTAGSPAPPGSGPSPGSRTPAPPRPTGSPWPTGSPPTPPPTRCIPADGGNAPPRTRRRTPRCCCRHCAAASTPPIPAPSTPSTGT